MELTQEAEIVISAFMCGSFHCLLLSRVSTGLRHHQTSDNRDLAGVQ